MPRLMLGAAGGEVKNSKCWVVSRFALCRVSSRSLRLFSAASAIWDLVFTEVEAPRR